MSNASSCGLPVGLDLWRTGELLEAGLNARAIAGLVRSGPVTWSGSDAAATSAAASGRGKSHGCAAGS